MTTRAGGSILLWGNVKALLPQIQRELVLRVGKLEIWSVNGMVIRDNVFIDFTEGGNSEAYQWMPRNTIWLDHDVDPREVRYVMLHELHELNKMQRDMDYEPAHNSANIVESQARHGANWETLWNHEVATYLRNNKQ